MFCEKSLRNYLEKQMLTVGKFVSSGSYIKASTASLV